MSTGCWELVFSVTKLTREVDRLGSTAARLKLKGIDGDPHKRWMMWFNSMQREKPYPPLTWQEVSRDGFVLEREPAQDRKSTRLNSSHLVISYAVFCLKKKKRGFLQPRRYRSRANRRRRPPSIWKPWQPRGLLDLQRSNTCYPKLSQGYTGPVCWRKGQFLQRRHSDKNCHQTFARNCSVRTPECQSP